MTVTDEMVKRAVLAFTKEQIAALESIRRMASVPINNFETALRALELIAQKARTAIESAAAERVRVKPVQSVEKITPMERLARARVHESVFNEATNLRDGDDRVMMKGQELIDALRTYADLMQRVNDPNTATALGEAIAEIERLRAENIKLLTALGQAIHNKYARK